ncbi:MAG: radical SAM protein [Anaerotruncus sp.]|nr:radical SAM protein [Anaerotruncus sp.]
MSSCEQIAALLQAGKPVALWGASNDAILLVNELWNRFKLAPHYMIDSDPHKQGKLFMGIPIVTFKQALASKPDLSVYIVGSNYKYQITGTLINQLQFPKERILNYEPVVWRKGCMFIENALQCVGKHVCFCSSDFGKKRSPRVMFHDDYERAVEEWSALRDNISSCLENEIPCSCTGCCCVKEDWYAANRQIHLVNYSEGGVCNFACIYCNAAAKHSKGVSDAEINLAEMLSVLEKKQLLAEDLHIDYSPGEPVLHPRKERYYESFCGKYTTLVMTNASVYDPSLENCLSAGKAALCVSVDAGTADTFYQVKGRNVFEKVCENLREYSRAANGVVGLKYIFLPDVNDNKTDIEGFVQLCDAVRPAIVLLSYDIFHPVQTLTQHTFEMVQLLIAQLDEKGIVWKNVSDVITRAFEGARL